MSNSYCEAVLKAIEEDTLGSEFQIALFSAALLSYRKDSCLRPFPEFLQEGSASNSVKNMEKLVSKEGKFYFIGRSYKEYFL